MDLRGKSNGHNGVIYMFITLHNKTNSKKKNFFTLPKLPEFFMALRKFEIEMKFTKKSAARL